MKNTHANLVDILDRLVALHGPAFAELLQGVPEACGIRGFIDRDSPSALVKDEDGHGYTDEEFEARAETALAPLVHETREIMEACRIKGRFPIKFHVDIDRHDDGRAYVKAMVTDGLGAVFVRRTGLAFENHGPGFFCGPAEIAVMAFSEHPQEIANLAHAARQGFDDALDFMIEVDLVHNQKGRHARIARKFADLFPHEGRARISRVEPQAVWLVTLSTQQPYKLFVSAAAREEMEGNQFVGAEFETLVPREAAMRMVH